MASSPKIAVQISAVDQFSATLAKLRKDLAATAGESSKLNKRAADITPVLNLDKVGAQITRASGTLRDAARSAQSGFGSFAGMIPGMGGVAGAATVAGIGALVTRYSDMGVALTNVSRLAGTTVQGMDSLRGAARLVGISAETADGAMVGLNKTIADAWYGKNNVAAQEFQRLGIGLQGVVNGSKRAEDILPRIADEVRKLASVDPRAAVTFMERIGMSPDMLPLLMRGADGVATLRREVESLYGNWDNYQRSSERFTESMGRMGIVTDRLGMSIMTALEPHLTPMLKNLADWVDHHNKDIGDTFDHIGHAISNIDWKTVGKGLEDAGNYAKTAAQWFDSLAASWDKINAFGQPVADFLNRVTGAGTDHPGVPTLPTGSPAWANLTAQRPGSYEYATPRERGGRQPGVGTPTQTFDTTLTPQARGLLDTIAGTESPGYNVMYGGQRFSDYSHHPNVAVPITRGPNAGQSSTAAGRYQFLKGTWDEASAALGLKDFSPASQDRAAWWLAQRDYTRRTGRNLAEDLKSNDPNVRAGIGAALRGTWTSLPGGIEAGTNTGRFSRELDANIARNGIAAPRPERRFGDADTDLPRAPQLAPRPTTDNSNGSTVRIEIDHTNAPSGVNLRATTQGDGAEIGGIRTRRAMPDAGPVWSPP